MLFLNIFSIIYFIKFISNSINYDFSFPIKLGVPLAIGTLNNFFHSKLDALMVPHTALFSIKMYVIEVSKYFNYFIQLLLNLAITFQLLVGNFMPWFVIKLIFF